MYLFLFWLFTVAFAGRVPCVVYGPAGHEIVGAIADERLAGTETGREIKSLLMDGMTLQKASVIADEIKGWDKNGADDPRLPYFGTSEDRRPVSRILGANPPTGDPNSPLPSHHWFHYTDCR